MSDDIHRLVDRIEGRDEFSVYAVTRCYFDHRFDLLESVFNSISNRHINVIRLTCQVRFDNRPLNYNAYNLLDWCSYGVQPL